MDIVCPVCGFSCRVEEENYRAPHSLSAAYDSDRLPAETVNIYYCEYCGHMFISDRVGTSYYEDYNMGAFWGKSFREMRQGQMECLLRLTPRRDSFLDIGCGIGQYLALARPHFRYVCGVEPSAVSADIAEKNGFTVMRGYFNEEMSFDRLFDAIAVIEVLEHIAEPLAFIGRAVESLLDDGVLLAEVPNGQRIRTERLFANICTDHIHYYSVSSLAHLMQRAGLQVLCARQSANENIIEVFARKSKIKAETFVSMQTIKRASLVEALAGTRRCAAWGAGAEALSYLGLPGSQAAITCIFDSDGAKWGHQLLGIPIVKPDADALRDIDAVILFANSHKEEIMAQLEALSFRGRLLQYGGEGDHAAAVFDF